MNYLPVSSEKIPEPKKKTSYPEPFASKVKGRTKRKLGNYFGLSNFGVNLTHLSQGAVSALLHSHSKQDEFIYILEGSPTLVTGAEEILMSPGDCVGFPAGSDLAHQLVNRSSLIVTYIEIGDRTSGDQVDYPDDDIAIKIAPNGELGFTHKDGSPY